MLDRVMLSSELPPGNKETPLQVLRSIFAPKKQSQEHHSANLHFFENTKFGTSIYVS
jgi:hypothetical protein